MHLLQCRVRSLANSKSRSRRGIGKYPKNADCASISNLIRLILARFDRPIDVKNSRICSISFIPQQFICKYGTTDSTSLPTGSTVTIVSGQYHFLRCTGLFSFEVRFGF